MANTFELIASSTVGSGGAASIDFTSIPSTYTDLCVKFSIRTTRTGSTEDAVRIQFNGSGGTAYTSRILYGSGSGAGSTSYTSAAQTVSFSADSADATASTFGNGEMYIPNYAGSNNKSTSSDLVSENNATAATAGLNAGLWASSAAINQVTLTANSGSTIVQYSTAYLYGIRNSQPYPTYLRRNTMTESTRPTRIEINCETGIESIIELTDAEIAQMEADRVAAEARKAEEDAAAQALADLKASAKAKLVAGQPLTAEEADTLVI